ncbi:coatomer WD associated region-domain-containing protein [Pisolithus albus]|nr:coatomer WD associated region-domain-containing protein [Pisolithus albus]
MKWKALGDRAFGVWRFDLVKEAFDKVGDMSLLMLLSLAVGNRDGVMHLEYMMSMTDNLFPNNLAFVTFFQLGHTQVCVDLLMKTNCAPEVALFTHTYAPSLVPKAVDTWHTELQRWNKSKIATSIGHPSEHAALFEA